MRTVPRVCLLGEDMLGVLLLSVTAAVGLSAFMVEPGSDEPDDPDNASNDPNNDPDVGTSVDLLDAASIKTADPGANADPETPVQPATLIGSGDGPPVASTDVETGFDGFEGWFDTSGAVDVTQYEGGPDGEELIVSGVAEVVTGSGADHVDASNMHAGRIEGGAGDTIIGSDVDLGGTEPALITNLHDGGTYEGGSAAERVVAHGSGAVIDGGAGNDVLLSHDGAATLFGGEGDDLIDSHAHELEWSESSNLSDEGGDLFADVIDGGAGNDRIEASGGDTITGGTGSDMITVSSELGIGLGPAVVTDYAPDEDAPLRIVVDNVGGLSVGTDGSDHVTVTDIDGDAHILVGGETIAILEDQLGFEAVVSVPQSEFGDPPTSLIITLQPLAA